MSERYARQMVLPEVGAAGQARLAAASVVVVGAGGLGCPVLQYLAGAGVGRLTIVDHDRVEETNLHRQPLYAMADIGKLKAEAAAAALRRFNPGIAVDAVAERLTPQNATALAAGADLLVDAADSFAATYVLSDACLAAAKPLVSASVIGLLRRRPELPCGLSRRCRRGRHLRHCGRARHGRGGAGRPAGASCTASSSRARAHCAWPGDHLRCPAACLRRLRFCR
jgi:hypothetical protein